LDYNTQKQCSYCGETIPAGAGRCPYCGSILEVKVDNAFGTDTSGQQQGMSESSTYTPQAGTGDENPSGGQVHENNMNQGTGSEDPYGAQYQNQQSGESGYNSYNTQRPYYPRQRPPVAPVAPKQPLSNGLKVFLTVLFTILPGIGQLAGIITAIAFMSSEDDSDRRSFGVALLVSNLVMFVLSCISCFVIFILAQGMS